MEENVAIYGNVRIMNKKLQKLIEKKNYCRYHIPGMGNLNRLKKNAIFTSAANSYEHEKAKFDKCYELACKGHNFITEAEVSIKGKKYRRDIVDISNGCVFEIETTKERAERFNSDPDKDIIEVIKLWEVKK